MVVFVTCKNEDSSKNEGTRVVTRLSIDFSEAQWQLNVVVLVTCKNEG